MTDIVYPVPSEGDLREVKVIEVIYVRRGIGGGRTKDDPFRLIDEYYTLDGALLARRDPIDHLDQVGGPIELPDRS